MGGVSDHHWARQGNALIKIANPFGVYFCFCLFVVSLLFEAKEGVPNATRALFYPGTGEARKHLLDFSAFFLS